jgi:hypothetical protein
LAPGSTKWQNLSHFAWHNLAAANDRHPPHYCCTTCRRSRFFIHVIFFFYPSSTFLPLPWRPPLNPFSPPRPLDQQSG